MKRLILALSVLTLVLSTAAGAQSRPSFTGKWTLVTDPNAPAGRGRLGQDFTVAQDDKTLTTSTEDPQRTDLNAVYNLDGSETRRSISAGSQTVELSSTAKWNGPKLVIVTKTDFGGKSSEMTQTWSLDSAGNLVIEMTSNLGGAAAVKVTYKKT